MTKTAKKLLMLVLALVLVAAFACSCGGEKAPVETSAPEVTEAPATEAPATEAPEATEAPATTAAPATEAPATTAAPEEAKPVDYTEYYDLYVQDGLVYHLNFAEAKEGTAIVGGEKYDDPDALANERFNASTSNYDPYFVFRREGVTAPISGGTATIATGGWKFVTPYVYSYWFNEDGSLAHTNGSVTTFDNFVTETGLAGVPYQMKGEDFVVCDKSRTIAGESKTTYNLVHTAPDNATGYYIAGSTWGAPYYSSAFGNGYLNFGNGNVPSYMNGVTSIMQAAGKYTVDLTVSVPYGKTVTLFMGAPYVIGMSKETVTISAQALSGSYISDIKTTNFMNVQLGTMAIDFVNTYSFTVDATDVANKNVQLGFYGNGSFFGEQALVSQTDKFAQNWQYAMRNDDTKTYALRVYDKVLSAEEVLQNHFADVVTFNALDITEFKTLDDAQKLSVYAAFEGIVIDEVNLQRVLNNAVAAAK